MNALRPLDSGVQIVSWTLTASPAEIADAERLLSEDEHRRAKAFTREDARRRFVVGRGTLRQHLGQTLGISPLEVGFRYGPAGKPEVTNDPALHFNLAHSDELAVLVTSHQPIGIDLERRRPMKNAIGLAERWFHPDEVNRITLAADSLDEFFRTWTMKEAALKLVGIGVGESLPKVCTPAAKADGIATGLPGNALGFASCRVEPIEIEAPFSAAIALPPIEGSKA